MVNSLLNAVTTQLGKTFGTAYRYYVEDVEQNLTRPCFTIDMLLPMQRSMSPVLYERTMPLVIHYFSDSNTTTKSECYSMAERILEAVEYLPYQNTMLRGEDISWQIVDGVLQVFITYSFISRMSKATEDNMEDILENVTRTQ